jgi:hypothetical protein
MTEVQHSPKESCFAVCIEVSLLILTAFTRYRGCCSLAYIVFTVGENLHPSDLTYTKYLPTYTPNFTLAITRCRYSQPPSKSSATSLLYS